MTTAANPSLNLYRHVRLEKFILVRGAIAKKEGSLCCWGELMHVNLEEMRQHGLDLVANELREFHNRDGADGCILNGFSLEAKKARKTLRDYYNVFVLLHSEAELKLTPMMDVGKDRAIGHDDDAVILPLPNSNEEFFKTLCGVFDKCCVTTI